LYTFTGASDGAYPYTGVILGNGGSLYGSTFEGGTYGAGVIYQMTPVAGVWSDRVLYGFTDDGDGGFPGQFGNLLADKSGTLYGGADSGSGGVEVVFEVRGPGDPFLGFPLQHRTASSAKIISVFDHSSAYQYCGDNIVVAYDGEQGDYKDDGNPTDPYCGLTGKTNLLYGWSQVNGNAFSVNGQYTGDGSAYFLEYDGHPGLDLETVDQSINGELPVMAAAGGVVTCSHVPANCQDTTTVDPCVEGPGEIKIKHPNGFFSVYLHLSSSLVTAGEQVSPLQQIGVAGAKGTPHCASPHLHFEIRKGPPGCASNQNCVCGRAQIKKNSCIPVDPYGWWGAGNDPYTRATNINLWK